MSSEHRARLQSLNLGLNNQGVLRVNGRGQRRVSESSNFEFPFVVIMALICTTYVWCVGTFVS